MSFIDKLAIFISRTAKVANIVSKGLSISDEVIKEFSKSGTDPRLSRPVREIMEVLDTYNIRYETEKKFDDCRNIRCLPFDFCIYTNNRFFLIEYDGLQHYEPCFGLNEEQKLENFNRTKYNDSIKEQYCRDHNITLHRIRYDEDHVTKITAILRRHRMI